MRAGQLLLLLLTVLPAPLFAKNLEKQQVPLRAFLGADQIWALRGQPVLGPEVGPVVDRLLQPLQEPGLPCHVGDLSILAEALEVQVLCGGSTQKWPVNLRPDGHFSLDADPHATPAMVELHDKLLAILNAHSQEIPFQNQTLGDQHKLQPPLQMWQLASRALLEGNLPNAATATDLALAAGPDALSDLNRFDAAILATAAGRNQKVRPWLKDWLKGKADDPLTLAAKVLAGQDKTALKSAAKLQGDVRPVARALVAMGRYANALKLLGNQLAQQENVDALRLAIGLADLTQEHTLFRQFARQLCALRPDDLLGWLNIVYADLRLNDWDDGLRALLKIPEKLANSPEVLLLLAMLADPLLDPLAPPPEVTPTQAPGWFEVAPSLKSPQVVLLSALVAGWQGGVDVAQKQLASLNTQPPSPVVLALHAETLLAQGQAAQARVDVEKAKLLAPDEPIVLMAALEVALQTGERAEEMKQAVVTAESRMNRPGKDLRLAWIQAATQLHTWGLTPPQRWPRRR